MNRDLVNEKLDSLRRCLDRIKAKTPPNAEILLVDFDLQDILVLNIQRAVRICVDLTGHYLSDSGHPPPQTMADSFEKLALAGILSRSTTDRMKKAVGFRNIAVHDYQHIDWQIVYRIVTGHLDDFKVFAREITGADTA